MQLNQNYQTYLDSALRDAIESYSHAYQIDQTPLPPELKAMVMKNCGWSEADQISDDFIASAGTNIWLDWKRSFRLTMLRQGMDPEQTDELKFSDLPPLDHLGSYTITQDGSIVVVTCEQPHLAGTGQNLSAAVENLYHAIRTQYFDDDYRAELDPRNWAAPADATPEQAAVIRFMIGDMLLTDEQKQCFQEAALAGQPLPQDIALSFRRQWAEDNREVIESSNAYVEENGLPLEKYRKF